jgi:glutathione S-transferase
MIRLYHAPLSRSCRVRWMLEELGLAYEIVPMQVSAASLRTPEFLAVNPNGRLPAIVDGELRLWESGAIVQYLVETYGQGRFQPAPGSATRPAYLQWFHWAEATALPPLGDLVQHTVLRPEEKRIPAVVPDAVERIRTNMQVVDAALQGRSAIVGDAFSAADVMLGYTLQLTRLMRQLEGHSHAAAYLEGLSKRPAFEKAFAREEEAQSAWPG